jgi:acetyl esterase
MPLNPQIKEYLEQEAASGQPPRSALSVEQVRDRALKRRHLAGEPVSLPGVRELSVPGPAGEITARVYLPDKSDLFPTFVYLHGGRFISGNLETHDAICRFIAQRAGCMVLAVDYRLAPEHKFPAAVYDAYTVTEWLESHGTEIGADPQRLAVGGDSAGGNLAAAVTLLAQRKGRPRFHCQVLIYPMLDATCSLPSHQEYASGYGPGSEDMRRGYEAYLPGSTDPKHPLASPLWAGTMSGLPPAFIQTAEYDSLRDEGEQYAEQLREQGVNVEHVRYEGAIHGIIQMAGIWELGRRALEDVADYLRETLTSQD